MIEIIRKIIQVILSIFILSIVAFYISRLSPGDPLNSYYGEQVEKMSVREKEDAMERLGLNEPIHIQYKEWLINVTKGNFGISLKYKTNVANVIKDVYLNTIVLGGISYILTFILSIILGIFCALNEEKLIDKIICLLGNISNSIPSFWIALIFILIFSINLKVLPSGGSYSIGNEESFLDKFLHLILPITVLVLSHLWYYSYIIRNKFIKEFKEDYIDFAIAKGLKEKVVIYKHCLRNVLPTIISLMSISINHIIEGTYIVEAVFSYPGLGKVCFESAKYHDYNMLLIICIITGTLVILFNMIGDFISSKLDPRIRTDRRRYSVM